MSGDEAHHVTIDGASLTVEDVVSVARDSAGVRIADSVKPKVERAREYVRQVVEDGAKSGDPFDATMYGVNTGFGTHKNEVIESPEDARKLQRNIVLSHAVGVGEPLPTDVVRAAMLLRANTSASGRCGVRFELVQRLVEMLNKRVHPVIPEQGSVGCSGDLAPLAHMSLVLIGEGLVLPDDASPFPEPRAQASVSKGRAGPFRPAAEALKGAGIDAHFELDYKEGLALTNGTAVMTAVAALATADAQMLAKAADIIGAMSAEALLCRTRAFDDAVQALRPYPGQKACAANIRRMIEGSTLVDRWDEIHDAYSIRCIPQVHGAAKDVFDRSHDTVSIEINSVTDDPHILVEDDGTEPTDGRRDRRHYEGGNFHGEPIAFAMDFLGVAASELASISERRIQHLLDRNHNRSLPASLTAEPGINSGFMLAQYTAAALVSENKVLAHPASVDSIPTSANVEDHVSMGTIAARKAASILRNAENVLAIELMCAGQALDFRRQAGTWPPGKGTLAAYDALRVQVPFVAEDRQLHDLVALCRELITSGELINAVESVISAKLYV
jgi:histidine ammonia-lyase